MTTTPTVEESIAVVSDHGIVSVMHNTESGQHSLRSNMAFAPGDVICDFYAGSILSEASYLTLQLDDDKHITLLPDYLQYTNHSCDPNAFFDTTSMEFVCIRDIQPGDELTFFYPSTEWEMAQPFICHCGSKDCLRDIRGASNMLPEILSQYQLTDFIRRKLASV